MRYTTYLTLGVSPGGGNELSALMVQGHIPLRVVFENESDALLIIAKGQGTDAKRSLGNLVTELRTKSKLIQESTVMSLTIHLYFLTDRGTIADLLPVELEGQFDDDKRMYFPIGDRIISFESGN